MSYRAVDKGSVSIFSRDKRDSNYLARRIARDRHRAVRHRARGGVETIAAVIDAYERGEIELPAVESKTSNTGTYHLPGGKRYSLATVARFLGWVKPSDGQATYEGGEIKLPRRAWKLIYNFYHAR